MIQRAQKDPPKDPPKYARTPPLLAVVLLLAVVACGGGDPVPADRVTLTWWDYLDHSPMADQAVGQLVKRYQDAHPEVEIRRTAIPRADFDAKLAQAVAAGTFPDIAAVDVAALPRLAGQDVLADLTPRYSSWDVKDRFLEPVRASVRYQDKFYGVPLRTSTTALLYNRDLFAAGGVADPPRTWEELRATAQALTVSGQWGLCFAANGGAATANFLPLLWQAGGDVTDVGADPGVRALSFVDGLVNVDRSAPPDVLRWNDSDVEREFAAGRCAMMVNGPWSAPALNSAGLDWGAAPLPTGAAGGGSLLGGEAWVLGRAGRHADRAWDVLRWLAEERDNATEFGAALNALPNRSDTVDDLAWRWDPNVPAFIGQLAGARVVYGPRYPEVSAAISTMVRQVLGRERPAAQAAQDGRAALEPLLR
ncbi:sugar ABC transporter substrate-binding protein [Actinosynnema sp. NPDC047251]|uniref:ABC-type transporter, substrate-binding lipoprotein, family 1 n=1 Tax=Saccharothrix espanaensis (strain ATCC 51144 / DSM 44229 / JCM 9112 / NBRC 15066 / NRRL 15764) TaxID=1179773 RepID=K0JVB7_SACES|nr:sugar ABC transporter substrate-binding protein [Saccharothrix espanaensis]CCH29931.1 ABC-type transporter, substrate-binding lipoprotein, family 1 [Saccharothrix espanaensis DSM 44229]